MYDMVGRIGFLFILLIFVAKDLPPLLTNIGAIQGLVVIFGVLIGILWATDFDKVLEEDIDAFRKKKKSDS
jgi:hypothetical protein